MTPAKRRTEIVKIIRQQHRITVDQLAKTLKISKETIRRDLTQLANKGKVHKFHGGASLPMMHGEGPFRTRMGEHVSAKISIAEQAVQLVSPGETLFMDTGSTTVYFAEKLADIPGLTVVTNSAEIARILSLSPVHTKTFLLGGEFNGDNRQTIGSMAISQIKSFRAHHAFLTVGAIDTRTGVMDFCINEAQIAKAMIEQAESLTILVDSSKFDRIASFEVCDLDRVSRMVSERQPTGILKHSLEEAGVEILCES